MTRKHQNLSLVVSNLDWGLPPAVAEADVQQYAPYADVFVALEGKKVSLRHALSIDVWGVFQNLRRRDKRGSGIAWRKSLVKARNMTYSIGVRHGAAKMLNRWFVICDIEIEGVTYRVIGAHRPPLRYAFLWPAFDMNLARVVRESPHPCLVGMDTNTRHHRRLAKKTGLRWVGEPSSIDGWLVDRRVMVRRLVVLPWSKSDHRGVRLVVAGVL